MTPTTCLPISSCFWYKCVICALERLIPNSPKSTLSLYAGFFACGKSSTSTTVPTRSSTCSNSPRRWFSFFAILRQHRICLFGCQVFVKLVVHLERRRPATSSNALHLFQRKLSVRGSLLVTDAQRLLAVL